LEEKPSVIEGANDGHVFKELDTGESYTMVDGVWSFINLGLSFIKATKSGTITTDEDGFYHVEFTTPFINSNYSVQLTCIDLGDEKPPIAFSSNKDTTGFDIQSRDSKQGDPFGLVNLSWLATRDYNP
jgi:hypothetical protein